MMTEEEGLQLLRDRVYYFSGKYSQKGRYQDAWKQLRVRALKRLRQQIEVLEQDELHELLTHAIS
jgi:hypothetical protein